jgi:hypothetical protein
MVSSVWKHFKKNPDDKDKATCNYCDRILKCQGGSTGSLLAHYNNLHKEMKESVHDTSKRVTSPQPSTSTSGEVHRPMKNKTNKKKRQVIVLKII